MDDKETTTLVLPALPKEEVHSLPLSPRSSHEDDETETEPDDSAGEEEEEGGAPVGAGRAVVAGGRPLKKGPWTPDEDLRLRTYVEAHGEGNWNQVQRNAGLNRCGKSCRLRWANHLRPNLKKGPFSKEEEQKIIELHAQYGNKWAKMANILPGRTDNEIKNFWNTRTKRLQKAGLDLYPDDLLSRLANQDMDCQSPEDSRGKKRPSELSNGNCIEFDDIIFEKLDYKKQSENFLAPSFMIQQDSISTDGINNSVKRHSSSGRLSSYTNSLMPEQVYYESEQMHFAISNDPPIVNGNFSTSGTIQRPMKMELPSVQYTTSYESSNSWLCPLSSATPVDQVDTISSPASVLPKPECFPSQNTSLLDAMVQQGHGLGDPTNFHGDYGLVPAAPCSYTSSLPYAVFDDNRLESNFPAAPCSYSSSLPYAVFDDNHLESNFSDEVKTYKFPASSDVLLGHYPDSDGHAISAKPRIMNKYSPDLENRPNNESINAILFRHICNESTLSTTDNDYQLGV